MGCRNNNGPRSVMVLNLGAVILRSSKRKRKAAETCGVPTTTGGTEDLLVVVLVFIDAPADAILAAIQMALFGLCQMAVVLRHVSLLLLLHAGVTALQIGSFLRTQRSVVDAVGDPLLLIRLASGHFIYARVTRIDDTWSSARGCGCSLSSGGADDHQPPYCKD